MAHSGRIASASDGSLKKATAYALPVQLANSPVYCPSLATHFLTRPEVDKKRLNGERINLVPTHAPRLPGMEDPENIDSCNIHITEEGKVEFDNVPELPLKLAANARHIVIPFPHSFLRVGANTRGQVDSKNAFAGNAKQFANTIEFLLSEMGIKYSWAGFLKNEILPEEFWPDLPENGKPDKNRDKAQFEYPVSTAYNLRQFVPNKETEWKPRVDMDSITGDASNQTMTLMVTDADGDRVPMKYPRFQMFWEMVPMFQKVNVDVPVNLVAKYPDELILDAETPLGYLLCHIVLLDPRLSLMKGLRRLAALKQRKDDKGLKDGTTDCLATKYALTPREYVLMMAMFASDFSITGKEEYEAPGPEIFQEIEPLNLMHVLTIKPEISQGVLTGYNKYRRSFNMHDYERERHKTPDDPNIPKPEDRIQLRYEEHFYEHRPGEYIYLFPVPNRVIRINAPLVYPAILNNCIIPFYHKSAKRSINIDIQYTVDIRDLKCPWNVTCPNMIDNTTVELEKNLLTLITADQVGTEADVLEETGYDVDNLRKQLGADKLQDTFSCSIRPNEVPPIMIANMIKHYVISGIENMSNADDRAPKCPPPLQTLFNYMKTERKKDPKYSLFQDLFDPDGLDFTHYKDLSIASTYTANQYNFMDKYYAIYQNHKYISLLDKVVLLQGRMRFGNQFFMLCTGPSGLSKSYISGLVMKMLAIPESMCGHMSETGMVTQGGGGFACYLLVQDDIGAGNNSLFNGGGEEKEADAVLKSSLTEGFTQRFKYHHDSRGGSYTESIYTDLRRSVWANSNATKGIAASLISRVFMVHIIKCERHLSMADLAMRLQEAEPAVVKKKQDAYVRHYRNRQVFSALVLYFVRAGAIQYDHTKEGRKIVSHMVKRFKDILRKHILKRDTIPITSRIEEGQIYPLAEAFMLERIYATICSGVWKGRSKHLYPGAPFDYDFLQEINEKGLLLPIEEDVLKALSYYEEMVSQETVHEIVAYIMHKVDAKTAAATNPDVPKATPLNIRRNIAPNQARFNNPDHIHLVEREWERSFMCASKCFFSRSVDLKQFKTDYNWIDLVHCCDLPNNITNHEILIERFADAIKAYNPHNVYLDKNVIIFHLNDLITNPEIKQHFPVIKSHLMPNSTNGTYAPELRPLDETEEGHAMSIEMQANKDAVERSTVKTATLLVRLEWLRKQVAEESIVPQTVCYPYPDRYGYVMDYINFRGSNCETAIQLAASHDGAFPQCILLNGSVYNRPQRAEKETRKVFSMPQIAKQIRIVDTLPRVFDEDEQDYYIGYKRMILEKMKRFGVNTGFAVRANEVTGLDDIFVQSQEENPVIAPEIDYFSTGVYVERLLDQMLAYGCYLEDGTIVREKAEIEEQFLHLIQVEKIQETFSPIAAELLFREIRAEYEQRTRTESPDYQTLHIEREMALSNIPADANRAPQGISSDRLFRNLGITGQKRAREDEVMQDDSSQSVHSEQAQDEQMEILNEDQLF